MTRTLLPSAAALCLCACGAMPGPVDAGQLGCPALTGDPVTHVGSITGNEEWGGGSLHQVTNDLTIAAGAQVTLSPCAQVLIKPGAWFYVNGRLVARGDALHPITIKGDGGRFNSISVRTPGTVDLGYVTIENAGANPQSTWGAALIGEGAWPVSRPIAVDHVTITDAAGYGVALRGYTAFTVGSAELTITNSGKVAPTYPYPVRMSLNTTGSLPSGQYTGNGVDEIQLVGENPHFSVEIDDVLHDRGVPYRMGGNGAAGELRIGLMGGLPTLTIEPGVTVKIDSGTGTTGRVYVGVAMSTGQLVAVGTAAKPITFTTAAATPAPGSWIGVDFANPVSAGSRLEHVSIEYAGAPGGASGYACLPMTLNRDDAALRLFSQPSSSIFQSSAIRHSLAHAILSAWVGPQVDLKSGNTFEDVVGCSQVTPKDPPNGTCPSMPMCQ